ncbi:hypothetical protein MSAN_00961400 [Mycena sanguinolenta]|uniref:Uncharacterized protein n=1 Tax=Mycena sanguinolenta TaxID=230812 RepID=A0A8H6YXH3_9AGAR|nr:hypothetical protein MSAN_00961400 [Mycena sanguinolenta]
MKTKKRRAGLGSSRKPGIRHWVFCDGLDPPACKTDNQDCEENEEDPPPDVEDSSANVGCRSDIPQIHAESDEFVFVNVKLDENKNGQCGEGWEIVVVCGAG